MSAVDFTLGGTHVLSTSLDGSVRVWALTTATGAGADGGGDGRGDDGRPATTDGVVGLQLAHVIFCDAAVRGGRFVPRAADLLIVLIEGGAPSTSHATSSLASASSSPRPATGSTGPSSPLPTPSSSAPSPQPPPPLPSVDEASALTVVDVASGEPLQRVSLAATPTALAVTTYALDINTVYVADARGHCHTLCAFDSYSSLLRGDVLTTR